MASRVLFFLLVTLSCSACPAASPETISFTPWLPQQSWSNGSQFDPRLDAPVRLWGAGMPLAQVFESVRQQTGVEIGFWPPDDYNARVCVNLYLNPEAPPTLRELMVQLSWALDCTFGIADTNSERIYYLLSTSVGQGVMERLWTEQLAKTARDEDETERTRESLPARLEELREALQFSREQAIGRYGDRDDLLLIAVLDPTRRAMGEFILSLPSLPGRGDALCLDSEDIAKLPADSQAYLREALRQPVLSAIERDKPEGYQPGQDPAEWFLSYDPVVTLEVEVQGDEAQVRCWGHTRAPGAGTEFEVPRLLLLGQALGPRDYVDLRRVLGEPVPKGGPEPLEGDYAIWLLRIEARRRMERQLERIRLSQETESLLAATPLRLVLHKPHALWQIQEAVAKKTGLHVVSDCFWQPDWPLRLRKARDILYPNLAEDMTALAALKLATVSEYDRDMIARGLSASGLTVSWEWRDAGRFLVFRSNDRDVWRGAFLPAEAVAYLDEWTDAALAEVAGDSEPANVSVTPDWRAFGRIAGNLDPAQQKWGGVLTYGDPADWRNACRQSFRERMMHVLWQQPFVLRFLSGLSDEQWTQLQASGLRVGSDIALSRIVELWRCRAHELRPFSLVVSSSLPSGQDPGGWAEFEEGDVVRLTRAESSMGAKEDDFLLEVLREGRSQWSAGHYRLPGSITLRPRSTESLIGSPPAEEPTGSATAPGGSPPVSVPR